MTERVTTDRVIVVGAGVIGLSCAVRLAESGRQVDVLARDLPSETSSAAGAGLCLPVGGTDPRVAVWAARSLTVLTELRDDATAGVRLMPGTLQRDAGPGQRLTVPLVDLPTYLQYLTRRLTAAGGNLTRLPLVALPPRGIVVNCTGVAARALAADPSVHAVRGQSVLVSDPGLDGWSWRQDAAGLSYVLPRGRDVLVGGTQEAGDWGATPDPDTARDLLARAVALVPALTGATVLGHRVGLRPARPGVRLEAEPRPGGEDPRHAVVHCYGHGADGVTLSWGCADDVAEAVSRLTAQPLVRP